MNYPVFTLQQINSSFTQKPCLQMSKPIQAKLKEGVELSTNAQGVLQGSFILGIIGNPGAGKSSLIEEFLLNRQFYHQRFERVLFIGPTLYRKLIQDQSNTSKQLDIQWIYAQIERCKQWGCKSLLIILDDVVSSLKNFSNPDFIDLFYNRRHLLKNGSISFILTAQKWNLVPTFIRTAYNMLIVFPLARQQLQTITRQINISIPRKSFFSILGSLKKYQFVYLNLENNKLFDHLWKQL